MNMLWKQLEVTILELIFPPICEQSTIEPEKEFSSKEYFLRFSHNLIFSFNRKSVNIVYKIENIKGPACVQRQGQGQSKSWRMKSVRLLVGWLFRLFNAITNLFHIDHNHIWLVDQEQFLDCSFPGLCPKSLFFVVHQTEHLSVGFILDPGLQLYAEANSSELERGPTTRIGPGLCTLQRTNHCWLLLIKKLASGDRMKKN